MLFAGGGSPLNVGSIIGIICAALVVLLSIVLFICWRRGYCVLSRVQKPLSSFIHVELKPYSRYQNNLRRVSRLSGSIDSDEGKADIPNNTLNCEGADVTACPIYASIHDNLNKNSLHIEKTCHEAKPNGSLKTPPPPPGNIDYCTHC